MTNCIEPFDFEVRTAADVLVVEATITTADQRQTIYLSRAANLKDINVVALPIYNPLIPFVPPSDLRDNGETNATVKIVDDQENEFTFSEQEGNEGIYVSDISFGAMQDRSYQLQITTSNNESYESDFCSPIGSSMIQDIYAERIVNDFGEEGMAIYIDGSDTSNSSNYFRYTYEETYKIIAPNWTPLEFRILREKAELQADGSVLYPAVTTVPRTNSEQVCYQTSSSNDITLVSTNALESSIAERALVRFISRDNPIISHRYSILVKQYLQSIDSYSYYQNLRNFTKSESVFSEVQPGFLQGNIRASTETNMVIGYFEVASSAEKRLFFDYSDFFPGEELPPYFFEFNCDRILSPCLGDPNLDGPKPPPPFGCPQSLVPRIKLGLVEYVGPNDNPLECEGPYYVTPTICGDCTILGSNIKPEFWVD
ncbi:MAG: DUF4249 domain-containing protein [Maribacter sp.]|uniref:DUF4249 domain-containing protein n=1 Tax=Maribacter sp. TaxID=1897614 RepID=UPI003296A9B4